MQSREDLSLKQLEKIVEIHSMTKGIISSARKILKAERIYILPETLIKCWTEKGLPSYSYTEFVHRKVEEYAKKFGKNLDRITSEVNRELKPYSSVTYETILDYMREIGLYSPKPRGGARNCIGKGSLTNQKKLSSEEKNKYRFCGIC